MTSFPRLDDEKFLAMIRELKAAGADVTLGTYQNETNKTVRSVQVRWETHNDNARVL